MTKTISPPEALIYAMVTTSAADRAVTEDELSRIGSIVHELPPFNTYTDDWLAGAAQECGKILRKPNGIEQVLEVIKRSLHPRLYETAYVLSAEVAAADLSLHADEKSFLKLLAAGLELDRLTCAALERAARARHQQV